MKKNLFLLGASFLFLSGCSDLNQQLHNYNVTREEALMDMYGLKSKEKHTIQYAKPANTHWVIGDREIGTIVYIPQGESMTNWTQSMYQIYNPSLDHSLEYYMQANQSFVQRSCSTSSLKVLSKSNRELTYQLSGSGCKDGDRVSITKVFQADDGVYWLQYFAIPGKVPESSIREGIKAVSRAQLV